MKNQIPTFQVTFGQRILAFASLLALLGLGISFISDSKETIKQARILSDIETPAASIIFTQRETLVYATRLAQWSSGGIARRDVQISRNLLAQRLAVIDSSGLSMGERAGKGYWSALKTADRIVEAEKPGILAEGRHGEVNDKLLPVIDSILSQSRQLVVRYQKSVDDEIARHAREAADREKVILAYFYTFLFLLIWLLIWNARTNFRNYRLAKEVLRDEQRELQKTIEQLHHTESTVETLKSLNESKNSFISTVNHELRTPLTSIIGYVELIRKAEKAKESVTYNKFLDIIDRNSSILLSLVESILSLSKIDAAVGVMKREPIQLLPVLQNSIFIVTPSAAEKNQYIELHSSISEDLCVSGDEGQLSQVIINLLSNAVKFSPTESTITVAVNLSQDNGERFVQLSVQDSGIGIPDEDVPHLFTRFFRARNATSDHYPGTGLGLAIVAQVLQNHGGQIEVHSMLGKGSTFTVTLPTYQSHSDIIELRRQGVLERAIVQLVEASPDDYVRVTHSVGGAISFYGFEAESDQILNFSRSLKSETFAGDAQSEIARFIHILQNILERLKEESNG